MVLSNIRLSFDRLTLFFVVAISPKFSLFPSVQSLGDKLESKEIAIQAGVSAIPGYKGTVESVEQALQLCNDGTIPYPVLLKAAAGGGGKGMRVCYNDQDIREAWTVAKAESIKFFKDDRLLIEKFIVDPHHIEFQVMAAPNQNGGTDVAVFPERECSIQRRNQKVIEETPSLLLTEETRLKMAEQVRRLCQVVGYQSAGTVEFLVDENQEFYFLEMNTRLQVEHPITEAVTGVDLVEAMLYVGAGKGLPKSLQASTNSIVPYKGHAIEARIYAEDPLRGFLPSTGPLVQYREPTTDRLHAHEIPYIGTDHAVPEGPYVRLDSGVAHGHVVSPYYDPMLSKLVYWSTDRSSAVGGLRRALDEYVIEGVQHNARLVQAVLREPAFESGATPTSFLPTHFPDGFHGVQLSELEKEEFAVAAILIFQKRQELKQQTPLSFGSPGESDGGVIVRMGGQFGEAFRVIFSKDSDEAEVERLDEASGAPIGEAAWIPFKGSKLEYNPEHRLAKVSVFGQTRTIQVLREAATGEIRMQMHGADMDILVQSPREYELSRQYMKKPHKANMANMVLSPMPGLLISYAVKPGDVVQVGQELCIVESMKMQNMIRSPRSGTIATCNSSVGASLKVDEIILTFEHEEDDATKAAA
jgi:propionyl-CoA carboxylase alpha chain